MQSPPPVASSSPSGENASDRTLPVRAGTLSAAQVRVFQILTTPSSPAAARARAVRREGQTERRDRTPLQVPLNLPSGHVPEDDRAVVASRCQPLAVGEKAIAVTLPG